MAKRIASEDAIAAMSERGFRPLEDYPGANSLWKVLCANCNEVALVSYTSVVTGGQIGCRNCRGSVISAAKRTNETLLMKILETTGTKLVGEYKNSGTPMNVECKECNHLWQVTLTRLKAGSRCPQCLVSANSKQANEIAHSLGLLPLEAYPNLVSRQWRMKCLTCGHVQGRSLIVLKKGKGCVACSKSRIASSLAMPQLEAIKIANSAGYRPLEDYRSQGQPWRCECMRCGKVSTPRMSNILQGNSCAYCSGVKVDPTDAEDFIRTKNFEPLEPYAKASAHWKVKCLICGHEIKIRYSSVKRGAGCVRCAGQVRDLSEAFAVMKAAGLVPQGPYLGANRGWRSICQTCTNEVAPTYSTVLRGGGCRFCSGHAVDVEFAKDKMFQSGLEVLEDFTSAKSPWRCKCLKCGALVSPKWEKILSGRGGCPACSEHGFKSSSPAILYLLRHDSFDALKIGITNSKNSQVRMNAHASQGWQVYRIQEMPGTEAVRIEAFVLKWWRQTLGLPVHVLKSDMPQGGFTETVSASSIDEVEVWQLVESLRGITLG